MAFYNFRFTVWWLGIAMWLYGLSDRLFSFATTPSYLVAGQIAVSAFVFICWITLKPEHY